MHLRSFPVLLLIAALLVTPARLGAVSSKDTGIRPLCFPAIPGIVDCVDPAFRPYWERNGGLPVFGYPLGPAIPEETADGLHTVQHYQRSRLELHPDAPSAYTVQLGRLGADRLAQLGRGTSPAVPPAAGCRFFAETGHNICGSFLVYWRGHGLDLGDPGISERESLALFGLPLDEPAVEVNSSGDRVLTQWFERARLEDHRTQTPASPILQGLLDLEVQQALTPNQAQPGFVEVQGDTLVQRGHPITLKGMNYYPASHPWGLMWLEWDGPTVAQELARARHELGINVVRVLVPYRSAEGWTDERGNVRAEMLDRLHQLVQLAGAQQLKVVVTLFDWHFTIPAAGSVEEQYDLKYLRTIVDAFKDDDRVLAWDLHNEPDNYPIWQGQATQFVDWLGRMADATRAIDHHHPLTIGVGKLESLWQAAPDGRTIASISDIVSFHGYDAARFAPMLAEARARTSKPLLLEEFGWPTGPDCRGPYFDESSQVYLYRQANQVSKSPGLAGMLSWWYQDPPPLLSFGADENGYYGLYRLDGTPKPATGPFRVNRVPALPSVVSSSYALTVAPPRIVDPREKPIVFDDGIVLSGSFMHFWNFFGGEPVFGRPLTLAYRDPSGKLVQYFQRARFELNESEHVKPIDLNWTEGQTPEVYLDRVHLTPLGQQALVGRPADRVADPGQPGVRYFPQTGHTLSGPFRALWETHGEIFFGPPISNVFVETINGRPTRVQYFTNFRFEQEGGGPVRLGLLGADALKTRQCPRPY